MITAISFFTPTTHGLFTPSAPTWQKPHTPPDLPTLIAHPVKYFLRLPQESRLSLAAAALALQHTNLQPHSQEIALLAANSQAHEQANQNYFQDYLTAGRTLGRGNLFIYTLPTSTLGEIAIALHLTGPSLFLHNPTTPLLALTTTANQLLADNEAAAALAIWTTTDLSICLAIQPGEDPPKIKSLLTATTPLNLFQKLVPA